MLNTMAIAFVVIALLGIEAVVFLTAIESGRLLVFLLFFGVGFGMAAYVFRRITRLSISSRIFLAIGFATAFGALFLVGLGY